MGEIEEMAKEVIRTLPHQRTGEDMREKIKEIDRLRILIINGVYFLENKRKLNRLREELRGRWRWEIINMWKELVAKIDLEKNPREFWKEVGRMMGRSKERPKEISKNENGMELRTREEQRKTEGNI